MWLAAIEFLACLLCEHVTDPLHFKDLWWHTVIALYTGTVFPRLIPHPRLVPQCGTIQIQTTLNSMFILIVTHPRIIPHNSVKNRSLLLKNYKIAKQSTK